jgi:hypothetical protein
VVCGVMMCDRLYTATMARHVLLEIQDCGHLCSPTALAVCDALDCLADVLPGQVPDTRPHRQ